MALAHNPKIVTDGLVLCLDAANPKSYPGSGTVWSDLSGNGNNGTLVNGVGYNSNNGGYLTFDGSNDGGGSGNFGGGGISSIQLYNRALTESEIQQNFEAMRGRYGI